MSFLILAIFANLWLYRILGSNFLLGVLIILASIFLKKNFKLFLLFFIPILFFQIKTTDKVSLTNIANDDRRLIDMRLKAYPAKFLRIGYWLEERKESLIFFRISKNLFENLDPNLYFFANHPRQRVGIKEFEKFPYLLLPVFLLGVINFLSRKKLWFWLIAFILPLVVISLVGNQNNLGPFSLFPFFAITIGTGLTKIYSVLKKKKWLISLAIIFFILVLIQIVSYQLY